MSDSSTFWAKAAKAIGDALKTPLAFFGCLSLLLVFVLSKIVPLEEPSNKFNEVVAIGIVCLLALIVLVSLYLVLFKPQNLVYDKEAIFRERERDKQFGTSDKEGVNPKESTEPK